jgi:hypothetical protein
MIPFQPCFPVIEKGGRRRNPYPAVPLGLVETETFVRQEPTADTFSRGFLIYIDIESKRDAGPKGIDHEQTISNPTQKVAPPSP